VRHPITVTIITTQERPQSPIRALVRLSTAKSVERGYSLDTRLPVEETWGTPPEYLRDIVRRLHGLL
jgi:hypothetical protein